MKIRKSRICDVESIYYLINQYADEGLMLSTY